MGDCGMKQSGLEMISKQMAMKELATWFWGGLILCALSLNLPALVPIEGRLLQEGCGERGHTPLGDRAPLFQRRWAGTSGAVHSHSKPRSPGLCVSPQEKGLQSLAYDKYWSFCQNISRWGPGPIYLVNFPSDTSAPSQQRDAVTFFQMCWMWCFLLCSKNREGGLCIEWCYLEAAFLRQVGSVKNWMTRCFGEEEKGHPWGQRRSRDGEMWMQEPEPGTWLSSSTDTLGYPEHIWAAFGWHTHMVGRSGLF